MRTRLGFTLLLAFALSAAGANPGAAQSKQAAVGQSDDISALLAKLAQAARARDSLTALADQASGATRDFLEEQIWQRHSELNQGTLELADKIESERGKGRDLTEPLRVLTEAVRGEWPSYLVQLQRRERALIELTRSGDEASGARRLAIESEITRRAGRLLEAYESFVNVVLALERVKIDVSMQRAFLVRGTRTTAEGLVTRLQLAKRDQTDAGIRLARDASNTEFRYAFDAADERLKRATRGLATAIVLMDRLGLETTNFRVALIATTGTISADIFKWKVLLGVLKALGERLLGFLMAQAPRWLFQVLLIAFTFLGFRALSNVARRVVRRAVGYSRLSALLRDTVIRLTGTAVMVIGFAVILTQLGVHVAPLLAGLGIAGFAAGGMILGNQPFDIGDEIEVAGVFGIVKRMTLVSTTILTPDNQTLIIPNSTVWGGVIRNRSAQPTRRVDLVFSIDYGDDIEKAERSQLRRSTS